jgi:hypothetical protein
MGEKKKSGKMANKEGEQNRTEQKTTEERKVK